VNVAREIPLNPNIVIYHTDEQLTTRIVEAYRSPDAGAPQPIRGLLELGAVSVHMTRYRMSVRKPRDLDMLTFLDDVEPAMCEWTGSLAIRAAPDRMPKWRAFDVACDPTQSGGREVYESSDHVAHNRAAVALFDIPGVAELVLVPDCVRVAKGVLFSWDRLAPLVDMALRAEATPGVEST
jgi:hypothetical protein